MTFHYFDSVISCRVDIEDSSYPYFVAKHVMRALLSNNGYSDQLEKEPQILEALGEDCSYLYLLNDVMGIEVAQTFHLCVACLGTFLCILSVIHTFTYLPIGRRHVFNQKTLVKHSNVSTYGLGRHVVFAHIICLLSAL